MKRILVTGAAGFIGYHTIKALHSSQNSIIGVDNFNDYYTPELKKRRAEKLKELGCPIITLDLCNAKELKEIFNEFSPTHVIHLAAQAGVRYSLKNPHAYLDSNITGFVNLLEILKNHPEVRTVYASSSSVYGKNAKIPFSESDTTDHPTNLYGATKKANEVMAYAYHCLYKLPLIGLRFFTVYGPWGRPDMAYYLFTQKILNHEPIEVFQGKSIQRDFTYIDDIVEGIILALNSTYTYEVFNLGNHQPVKLNDFIAIIENLLGKKAQKVLLPQALGDMEITYADISKSHKMLGYKPKTDLEKGLAEFVHWYKQYNMLA